MMLALARATVTASPVMRAISSGFTIGDAAKPQAPSDDDANAKAEALPPSLTFGTSSVLPVPRSGLRRMLTN